MNDTNPSELIALLEMTGVHVSFEEQRAWTEEQCREARSWATARWAAQSVMFDGRLRCIPAWMLKYVK